MSGGRAGIVTGGPVSAADLSSHNQPIDLAQKVTVRHSEPQNVKGTTGTVVHYATQIITQKPGAREGISGATVALFSRTPTSSPSNAGTAINLASSGSGTPSGTLRTVTHSTSTGSSYGYHIPRGPSAVANMAVSRMQAGATSIVRANNQSHQGSGNPIGLRGSIGGQRVVPITTTGGWARGSPSPALANKPNTSSSLVNSRSNLHNIRPGSNTITTYHAGVKSTSLNSTTMRGPIRGSMINTESVRGNQVKGVHISQPLVQSQVTTKHKYGSTAIRCVSTTMTTTPNAIYSPSTPSGSIVTTLASSGGSNSGLRGSGTSAIAVRITSAPICSTSNSQMISQAGSNSSRIQVAQPPHARNHVTEHHVPLKTPVVRAPLHHNKSGNQYTQGPKVITQPALGPPVPLPQMSGLSSQKVASHQIQHNRAVDGAVNSVNRISVTAASVPTAKVLPQLVNSTSIGQNIYQGHGHTSTGGSNSEHSTIYRTTHTVTTLASSQSEKNTSQYITPYYNDGSQGPYSVIPHTVSSHILPGGAVRVNAVSVGSANSHTDPSLINVPPQSKPNSSPRPSILRKRPEPDNSTMKAVRNLTASLSIPHNSSPSSPIRPESRGNITTINNTSTPIRGMLVKTPPNHKNNVFEDGSIRLQEHHHVNNGAALSMPSLPLNIPHVSLAGTSHQSQPSIDGLSPRKKPRKQQLMGNELHEVRSSEEDFELPLQKKIKTDPDKDNHIVDYPEDDKRRVWSETAAVNGLPRLMNGNLNTTMPETSHLVPSTLIKPSMTLINSYRQTWKPCHNHFSRHSDIRPKEEKKHTVNEMANQKQALQRVNGWKVVHLTGQVEDIVGFETEVVERFQVLLNTLERVPPPKKSYKDFDKDINQLSELVKANVQRSKILGSQMNEAKVQMTKLFDHKKRIVEIMNKYSNKRNIRKKEKT